MVVCISCGASNNDAAEHCISCGRGLYALTQGTVVDGRYEVVELLGKGGMGLVYRVRDRSLDEPMALKVLRRERIESADAGRRFRSEIKLARRIRHPNVCAIHEYGESHHIRYIAMELVDGVDLKQVLRSVGRLPLAEAVAVSLAICDGLSAIHDAGIVHRDLKTANIMVDRNSRIRLMDFGIAKRSSGETTGTATGLVVGTPEYMSPEQGRGDRVDSRSDIYSLGIVMFELVTCDLPFRADTPIAVIYKHINDPPVLERPKGSEIPPELIPILRTCLAKRPHERYGSAGEVRKALEGLGVSVESGRALVRLSSATMAVDDRLPTATRAVSGRDPAADALRRSAASPAVATAPRPVKRTRVDERTEAVDETRQPVAPPGAMWPLRRWVIASLALAAAAMAVAAAIQWNETTVDGPGSRALPSPPVTLASPASSPSIPIEPTQPEPPAPSSTTPRLTAGIPTLVAPALGAELQYPDPSRSATLLEWRSTPPGASYHVVVGFNASLERPLVKQRAWKRSSIELRGLDAGRYYWRVAAIDDSGVPGDFSRIGSFSIARVADPAPTALMIAPTPAPAAAPTDARPSSVGTDTAERVPPSDSPGGAQAPPAPVSTTTTLAPAPTPEARPVNPPDPRSEVKRALEAYEAAFESLDPVRVRSVYPMIPEAELGALRTFKEYQLQMSQIEIEMLSAVSARVSCLVGIVVRSGAGKRFSYEPRKAVMEFEHVGSAWVRRR